MRLIDLASELQALASREPDARGASAMTTELAGQRLALLRVPEATRYEGPVMGLGAAVVVLDGVGTLSLDGVRATVSAGQVLEVPAGHHYVAIADAGRPLVLLVTSVPGPTESLSSEKTPEAE